MKITVSVAGKFHAFYLASQLQKRRHLHRLITTYPKFEVAKYGIDKNKITSFWYLEAFARTSHALRLPRHFGNVAKKKGFLGLSAALLPRDTDLFVGWSGGALKGIRRAKSLGVKSLVVRGSTHILHQRDVLKSEYEKLGLRPQLPPQSAIDIEQAEYGEADYIYNQTDFVKKTFVENGVSAEKIVVTPTGVNLQHFFPVPKEDGKFRIIYCGGLSVRKGVHYLLQAYRELKLPNSELWLIGGETADTPFILNSYSSPGVICKGVHPERDLHKLYSQGSIFCCPSLEEGLAMVQAQAMACGLPLICTDASGGGEFLKNGGGGICIPAGSTEAIKNAILQLYEDSKLRGEMGKAAQETISDGFTWDHYGDRICAIYKKILAE
ncbi:MAG: glycosyl transferase group 1 [Verrucomicrobiales bacterium]|nr:glycosyl transferase group 1 [Verrucomicrobiales bacterium]